MKKILLFLLIATILTSCYGSRKNGCPTSLDGNPKYKFRG